MKILIFLFLTFFYISSAIGANICVTPAGSGNKTGTDWSNAADWSTLNFVRGNTYYLAGGIYTPKVLNTPNSGSTYIYIKKATSIDHVTDIGWQDIYGANQAIIEGSSSNLVISTDYWEIDGVFGNGSNKINNYGIKLISLCNYTGSNNAILVPNGSFISIKNIAIVGCGDTGSNCLYGVKTNTNNRNINYQGVYFYGTAVQIVHYQTDNVTIDNCYFDSNWSNASCHGEQLTAGANANDWVIKNSTFYNSTVGAIAVHDCDGCGGSGYNSRWKIYNNLFIGGSVTMGVIGCADSGSGHPDIIRYFESNNNTIVNVIGAGFGGGIYNSCYQSSAEWQSKAYNNLFYGTSNPVIGTQNLDTVIHDYNGFFNCTGNFKSEPHQVISNSNPFIDLELGDYRLDKNSLAKDSGINLEVIFAKDRNGIDRPKDSGWDIGAYEYYFPKISPPSGLKIISK